MGTYRDQHHIPYAPTETAELYPDSDGQPMAVSDLHRRILTRTLGVLDTHFAERPEVYVSGDILMYYVEGDPRKSVAPDVLVTFGMGKKNRRTYLVWEEGKVPDFAMEFSSKGTYRNDLGSKMQLYASLGIQDYFLYDAEGLYLSSPIMGFTLVDGSYVPISAGSDGGLHSTALGLDFYVGEVGLGIYDPVAGTWLQTPAESAIARAEIAETRADREATRAELQTIRADMAESRADMAESRADMAESRADEEATARQRAETELAELQEELERLKART
ncbi:MAG: Uma2 family endonuclease [Candidatus Poribacteria bacterium]|nr:Uma2 family endonuclease [Candidatus Poribacteria bacterium]